MKKIKIHYKKGDIIQYSTPLAGRGEYISEVIKIVGPNCIKVKVKKIIKKPTHDPLSPQKVGDIDHLCFLKSTKPKKKSRKKLEKAKLS